MNAFSDYKIGALSEVEFHNKCVRMNAMDRDERANLLNFWYEDDDDDEEDDDDADCY